MQSAIRAGLGWPYDLHFCPRNAQELTDFTFKLAVGQFSIADANELYQNRIEVIKVGYVNSQVIKVSWLKYDFQIQNAHFPIFSFFF